MAGLQDHRRCHLTPLELAERLLVTERELIVAKDRVEREQEAYRMKLRALCALQAQYSLPLYSGSARQSLPVAAAAMHMQPARHQDQVEGGDQGLPAAAEAGQGSLVLPVHTSQAGAGTEPSTVRKRAAEQDQVTQRRPPGAPVHSHSEGSNGLDQTPRMQDEQPLQHLLSHSTAARGQPTNVQPGQPSPPSGSRHDADQQQRALARFGPMQASLARAGAAVEARHQAEQLLQDMEAMLSQWQAVPAPEAPTLPPQTPLPAPRGPGPSACSSLSALPDVPVPDMPAEGQPAAQQPTAPPGPPRSLPSDSSGPASASPGPPGPPAEPARTGSDQGPNVPVRAELLERYRNKRARRGTQPPARYAGRKATADSRPRVRGRFISAPARSASDPPPQGAEASSSVLTAAVREVLLPRATPQ